MSEDTQPGVDDQEVVGTNNPRDIAMAEIAEKAARQHEADIKSAEENIFQEGREEQETQPVETLPVEDMITIKVDGVERQVSRAMVEEAGVKTLQKESASDRRLEEATRLLNEAQEMHKKLRPSNDAVEQPLPVQDEAVQLARAIQYGTEDEAAAVIKLLQQQGREQATPEQIAQLIDAQVKETIEVREAFKVFAAEYPEIQQDPHLGALAIQMEGIARSNGDKRPHKELYTSIGEHLRQWRGVKTPAEDKQTRKESIQAIPIASGRRPAPDTPKEPSPSDIVNDMRKARHQI